MRADAMAMVKSWKDVFAETPPVGYIARLARPDSCIRVYTLPRGKRLPETEIEKQTIVDRLNALCSVILSSGERVLFFVTTFGRSDEPRRSDLPAPMSAIATPPLEWVAALSNYVDTSRMVIWGGATDWKANSFDAIFVRAAKSEIGPIALMCPDRRNAIFPYDGGADLFVPELSERTMVVKRFKNWVARP